MLPAPRGPEEITMCRRCDPPLRRRALLALAAAPPATESRPGEAPLVEPRLRLAVPPATRRVALTLDGCAGQVDDRILDALVRDAVPATLFVTARWLRRNPATVARLRARPELFSLQNHGARHVPAVLGAGRVYGLAIAGTLDAVAREVSDGAAAIRATGAPAATWYRGAAALYSPAALPAIAAMGFRIAGFSLNADAGASLPAAAVAGRIAAARGGDVIIAHMNQPDRPSGAGVVAGVAALLAGGFEFVGLDAGPTEPPGGPPRPTP